MASQIPRMLALVAVTLGAIVNTVQAPRAQAQTAAEMHQADAQALLRFTAGYDILVWPAGTTLTGCFFVGQRLHRQLVIEASAEWAAAGNIRFDFGQAPGYRDCDSAKPSHIRVGFQPSLASQSRIGSRALEAAPNRPTLFIGVGGVAPRSSDEIREAVLHELGHALGLPHEHQHPASPCPADFMIAAVCDRQDTFAAISETERRETLAMMQSQVRLRRDADVGRLPKHDVDSIMHYRFPPSLLAGGTGSACHSAAPRALSPADRAKIAERYPADIEQQRRFLIERGRALADDLAASRLAPEIAERMAALAEAYVARLFGDLGFRVPYAASNRDQESGNATTVAMHGLAPAMPDAAAALCQPRQP